MKHVSLLLAVATLLLLAGIALAEGSYTLDWWTVGGIPSAAAGVTPWAAPLASPTPGP